MCAPRDYVPYTAQRAASIGLPIGLHLNLTEGPPLAAVNMVPSLVQPQTQWWFPRAEHDRDGDTALHMRGKIGLREALKQCQISMEEVGIEVEAQFEAFKNLTGATPVYLNGHQHVHVLPGIAAVVARVAAREGVQFMRIPDELPRHFQEHVDASRCSLYKSVSSQAADARFVFRDESLQTSDSFIGLGLMGADCSPDRLFLRLQALLQDAAAASCAHDASPSESARNGDGIHGARPHMCDGSSGEQVYIGEYMCHVGKASASGDDFNRSKEREEELRVLTLPEVHRWLQRNNVVLTSFHELARLSRSSRRAASPSAEPLSPRLDKMQRGRRLESGEEEEVGGGAGRQTDTQTGGDRDDTNVRGNSEPARSEAKRGGGNLLILSSMTAATGNATTAKRLAGVAQVSSDILHTLSPTPSHPHTLINAHTSSTPTQCAQTSASTRFDACRDTTLQRYECIPVRGRCWCAHQGGAYCASIASHFDSTRSDTDGFYGCLDEDGP